VQPTLQTSVITAVDENALEGHQRSLLQKSAVGKKHSILRGDSGGAIIIGIARN
jgi:hypothetical protein